MSLLTLCFASGYVDDMATRAEATGRVGKTTEVEAAHDAFVRAKVREGLEQSRARAAMIPLEQAWRDLTR